MNLIYMKVSLFEMLENRKTELFHHIIFLDVPIYGSMVIMKYPYTLMAKSFLNIF